MQIELWWLVVIPFMFILGWISANWDRKQQKAYKEGTSEDLAKTILLLSEEKISKASSSLLNAAKKDPNSYMLQLSLGILYRRSGFVDRAIEVHGSLLTVKDLSHKLRNWIVLELAKDYLEAGLYDRADLSLELLEKTSFYEESLELRLYLAQRLKNWAAAIKYAESLEQIKNNSLENLKIHFLCEMAELGDDSAKEKAKDLGCNHPRVQVLVSTSKVLDSKPNSSGFYSCSICGAKFSNHFWRCHVCNSWDSAN